VKSVYNNVCACVCNVNRFSTYSHDLGVAAGTGGCKELPIAVLTVNIILLLHKADISQRCVAIMAVELLWMPGTTQCHQEWSPEESKKHCGVRARENNSLDIHEHCHFLIKKVLNISNYTTVQEVGII